jgi:chromodomain-helicase-DNA-binding protein 4
MIRDNEIFNNGKIMCHVVIASYQHPISNGSDIFKQIEWEILVADEGHQLKNDDGKSVRAIKAINSKHRIVLSGTPLQNNVRELYTLLSFLYPDKYNDVETWLGDYGDLSSLENVQKLHDVSLLIF